MKRCPKRMLAALACTMLGGTAQSAAALTAPGVGRVTPCVAEPSVPRTVDVRYACGSLVFPENRAIAGDRCVRKKLRNARPGILPDEAHVQIGAVNVCAMTAMVQFVKNLQTNAATNRLRDRGLPGFILPNGKVNAR
jgi:hypothetical protein